MDATIEPYETSRRDALLSFAANYGLRWGHDAAQFVWKYERPLPPGSPTGPPRLWIVREGDRVLGMLGTQPVSVRFQGMDRDAAFAMDLHLDASLRGKGLGRRLLEHYEEAWPFRLMAFSTPQAHAIYLKRGYVEIPRVTVLSSLRLRPGPVLRLLARRGRAGEGQEVRLDLGKAAVEAALVIPGAESVGAADLRGLEPFLERCRAEYEFAVVRDGAALAWRYLENPRGGAVMAVRDGDGHLRAVFALAGKSLRGVAALVLGDLYAPAAESAIEEMVVAALPALARRVGADAYAMLALAERQSRQAGHFQRQRSWLCSVGLPPGVREPDFRSWYLSGGDSDFVM